MKILYLYVKELPDGLKYLGTTSKNPYKYKGSGKYWKRHIKKHNYKLNDIKTTILFSTYCRNTLKEKGLYYSKLYNVVEDSCWANLIPESGESSTLGYKPTEETKQKYLPKISHKVRRIKDDKIYNSVNEAARENNLYSSHLRHRLKLNDVSIGFEYVDKNLEDKAKSLKNKRIQDQNYRKIKNINKTSRCLGVSWDKQKQKWVVAIRINGKKVFLGRYNNEEDACKVYQTELINLKTK
jgi:hypothetical protein